jgi:heme-degrading monooxygenase HmoA
MLNCLHLRRLELLTLSTIVIKIVDSVNLFYFWLSLERSIMFKKLSFAARNGKLSLGRLAVVGSVISLLTGCAISTPFPRLQNASSEAGKQPVVLVLTRIVVDPQNRAEFDRQTSRVIDSMPSQPGLMGFSARRELWGNQGWTMSVWASQEARAQFVRSAVHQEAMAKSKSAVVTVELKRLTLPRDELPKNWTQALQKLDEPGNLRNYWE